MLSNHAELFNLIAEGGKDAFAEVYEYYFPSIQSHVKRITRNPSIAPDISQEVFLRLWLKRTQVKKLDNPSAWLYRVAANLSVSYLRQKHTALEVVRSIEPYTMSAVLERGMEMDELQTMLQLAVGLLPEKRREVYLLQSEEELSYREIADRLGISESTVRNHMAKSRAFLREYLVKHATASLFLVPLFPL